MLHTTTYWSRNSAQNKTLIKEPHTYYEETTEINMEHQTNTIGTPRTFQKIIGAPKPNLLFYLLRGHMYIPRSSYFSGAPSTSCIWESPISRELVGSNRHACPMHMRAIRAIRAPPPTPQMYTDIYLWQWTFAIKVKSFYKNISFLQNWQTTLVNASFY